MACYPVILLLEPVFDMDAYDMIYSIILFSDQPDCEERVSNMNGWTDVNRGVKREGFNVGGLTDKKGKNGGLKDALCNL